MKKALLAGSALVLSLSGLAIVGLPPAGADPVNSGRAFAFGGNLDVAGSPLLIDEDAEALAQAPPFPADVDNPPEAFLPVVLDPLAISLTLGAVANVHEQSDIASALESPSAQQPTAGPYNARALGFTEGLSVLVEDPLGLLDPITLLEADAVRGEAVAVCSNGQVTYSASSEVVNLELGGNPLLGDLNDTLSGLLDSVSDLLDSLGLSDAVLNLERNVVTPLADGIAVDALLVEVLPALGGTPLVELRLGHAEVSGVTCAPSVTDLPECSDTIDNDGDGRIDFPADPDCDSPQDDSEFPECSDGIDNDGDGLIDFPNDPGCTDAQDDSELDGARVLPRTGGDASSTGPLAIGLLAAVMGALALRRRSLA